MATTTQIAAPPRTTSPIALWHLLSLDAPTVAALWTWCVARAAGIHLPLASLLAIAIAVWILYAADRLLDTRHLSSGEPYPFPRELEARHLFHFRHRRAFLLGVAAAAVVLGALLPHLLQATLHVYLFEGALLAGWFLLIHATRLRLPKEFAVGAYFAVATFTPTIVRRPPHLVALLVDAILFAVLCALNCLFIHAWERSRSPAPNALPISTAVLIFASGATAFTYDSSGRSLSTACALSAALLLCLDRGRPRLSRIHLRAAADLALLTPLLLLPFMK